MKYFALLLAAVLLLGCEEREVTRKRNEDKLPAGCRIIDLDYGELRAAVVCDGRPSTTSLRSWSEYDPNTKLSTTKSAIIAVVQ